jgi:hypothetical protein
LATWIYLASLALLLPYLYLSNRRNQQEYPHNATKLDLNEPSHDKSGHVSQRRGRRIWTIILRVLYYFFIVAAIAMQSLEIARLVDAELGIGLLPFTYAGIVLAALLHGIVLSRRDATRTRSVRLSTRLVNAAFWLILAIVLSIKIATYCKEGVHSRDGRLPVDRYKVTDEVTDLGVLLFLVVVLAVLEMVAS